MLEARDITYRYPHADHDALAQTSVAIGPGQLVVLLGANGSGKSTLARVLTGSFEPTSGGVTVDGSPLRPGHSQVGLVRQDPQSQLVCEPVYDEVAFGPRNYDMDAAEVDDRVRWALESSGISGLVDLQTSELSGGEQQRLALAGVLAVKSPYLVLDEPVSQLDSTSAMQFMTCVRDLVQGGVGVLLVTHYHEVVEMADLVMVMDEGRIAWQGTPQQFAESDEARELSRADLGATYVRDARAIRPQPQNILKLVHATVSRGDTSVLHDVTLRVPGGTVMLLSGRSGSGKSTLGLSVAGVLELEEGKALIGEMPVEVGDVGLCMQRAEDQLFCDTVFEEVAYGPKNLGLADEELRGRTEWALEAMGVGRDKWDKHPLQLSGGERRRVAIAGIVAMRPRAYVFDEPTDGLDGEGRATMHTLVRELASSGAPVVVISHEVAEWLGSVDEVTLLAHGEVAYSGSALDVATSSVPYRLAELQVPRSVREREDTDDADELYAALRRTADAPAPRLRRVSLMHKVPAWVKVLWVIVLTVVLFATFSLQITLAAMIVSIVAVVLARVRPRSILNVLAGSAIVLLFALVANTLVLDGTGDIQVIGTVGLSSAGAWRALISIIRIESLVFAVAALAVSTTATEVANVLLAPVRLIGGRRSSVEGFCMIVTLTLRLMPIAYEEFRRIECAQRIRKAPLQDKKLGVRLRAWVAVLVPVIVSLNARSVELGYALADRGLGARYAKDEEGQDGQDER